MRDEERQAFLAAIAASPDDDLPRLVYADFLEERGDGARADRIRHGCNNPGARYSCWGDESVGLICCQASPCPLCDDLHGEGVPWSLLGESRYYVRRGFISEVTLAWQNWIGGPRCENCDGQGHTNLQRDLRSGDPLWEHYVCPDCNGIGTGVPNHAAILAACPIRGPNVGTQQKPRYEQPSRDGLVRLTTWPDIYVRSWPNTNVMEYALDRQPGQEPTEDGFVVGWHDGMRQRTVESLLSSRWPGVQFDLSRTQRDGFDFTNPVATPRSRAP